MSLYCAYHIFSLCFREVIHFSKRQSSSLAYVNNLILDGRNTKTCHCISVEWHASGTEVVFSGIPVLPFSQCKGPSKRHKQGNFQNPLESQKSNVVATKKQFPDCSFLLCLWFSIASIKEYKIDSSSLNLFLTLVAVLYTSSSDRFTSPVLCATIHCR